VSTLDLPLVLAGVMVVCLTLYVILGGADFGGGVWDLLASGPRRHQQRALIADVISPIWEANHVWLIIVVVILFTAFPKAFSTLAVGLHIPLSLMLVGVVLRGSAFTFRAYDSRRDTVQRRWGVIFAGASTITPVLLGICAGAVASGQIGAARTGDFTALYVTPWMTPFAMLTGVLTLCLFAFLAAVFLTVEAEPGALQDDFRARALWSAVALAAAALALRWSAQTAAPHVSAGLTRGVLPWAVLLTTAVISVICFTALWTRRYRLARGSAVAQVALIIWGWAFAQRPYIVPETLTIEAAAAPTVTLRLLLIALCVGTVILVPSLWYLFRVFSGGEHAEQE
jgi:cytochrome d ubiquinol oxidase subunit II